MNINWVNDAVFYHIYPLGFCGAPKYNEGKQYNLLLQGKTSWIGGIS